MIQPLQFVYLAFFFFWSKRLQLTSTLVLVIKFGHHHHPHDRCASRSVRFDTFLFRHPSTLVQRLCVWLLLRSQSSSFQRLTIAKFITHTKTLHTGLNVARADDSLGRFQLDVGHSSNTLIRILFNLISFSRPSAQVETSSFLSFLPLFFYLSFFAHQKQMMLLSIRLNPI